jgi:hypothetical protein
VSEIGRVVALGASNLTRGFPTVVCSARAAWGRDVQVLAALGHGRSYGARSTFLARTLPGILQSGLWRTLESEPVVPTRALVTDVGNDILYGFPEERVLGWVDEALTRLRGITDDVVVTDLPMDAIRRLSRPKYYAMRSLLVPSSRLSLAEAVAKAERVNQGLTELAEAHRARLLRLDPTWYGFDPIHIRPSLWHPAWQTILGVVCATERSRAEALRLYFLRTEQPWLKLRRGAHVRLY